MNLHIENELLESPDSMQIKVYPGKPYPLGATWDGNGINFSVFQNMRMAWSYVCLTPAMMKRKI